MTRIDSPALSKYLSLGSEHILSRTFWISTFVILTAIGAQIEIATYPVPYTLQTFFVLLSGLLLGSRIGFLSMTFYLALGSAGFPVFSSGGFGLLKLIGPTGGYLMSFPIAAFVIGSFTENNRTITRAILGMLAGLVIIFGMGTLYLHVAYMDNIVEALKAGFLIFSWWDVLKLIAAAAIYHRFRQP